MEKKNDDKIEEKETRYKAYGLSLISNLEPGKGFFYKRINRSSDESKKYSFESVKVLDMTISGGPERFYLHANIVEVGSDSIQRYSYEISEDDYKKFQLSKRGRFRLDLLTKASGGLIVRRKQVASKHIDIRVTPALYEELEKEAEKCKMPISEYCRRHLEGKKPVAAFTENELKIMKIISHIGSDMLHYKSALEHSFFKSLSAEERIKFLGTSEELKMYRQQIGLAVKVINKLTRSSLT